jgi:hypothetical protein
MRGHNETKGCLLFTAPLGLYTLVQTGCNAHTSSIRARRHSQVAPRHASWSRAGRTTGDERVPAWPTGPPDPVASPPPAISSARCRRSWAVSTRRWTILPEGKEEGRREWKVLTKNPHRPESAGLLRGEPLASGEQLPRTLRGVPRSCSGAPSVSTNRRPNSGPSTAPNKSHEWFCGSGSVPPYFHLPARDRSQDRLKIGYPLSLVRLQSLHVHRSVALNKRLGRARV